MINMKKYFHLNKNMKVLIQLFALICIHCTGEDNFCIDLFSSEGTVMIYRKPRADPPFQTGHALTHQ